MRKSGRVDSMPVREAQEVVRYSRRLVLGLLASAAGSGEAVAQAVRGLAPTVAPAAERIPPGVLLQNQPPPVSVGVQSEIILPIIRPDDLLVLTLALRNLQISQGPGPRQITLMNPAQPGILIAAHQPQSILEQTWQEDPNASAPYPPAPPGVASTRMSGSSYVAYSTPAGFTSLAFTLKDLLNALQTWPMRLDINAQPLAPDPLKLVGSLHSLDSVKLQLEGAAQALKGQLAAGHSKAVVKSLERAAGRLSAAMSDVARQGRAVTQADLKRAVSAEVNASFGPRAANPSQRLLASSYVEAVASAGIVGRNIFSVLPQPPHPPAPDVTQLEIPYKLIQSPLATAGWTHATDVVRHGQHAELWHSRLGTDVGGVVVELDGEPLRALWTHNYGLIGPPAPTDPDDPPWLAPMRAVNRRDIVELTSDWFRKTKAGNTYVPQPSLAKRLMLTALGGTLDLDGHWPLRPNGVDLEAWNHKASIGRDFFVRLVWAGWLFPFGHAASYVQITERKFGSQSDGKRVATLRMRQFIIVREHSKSYPGPGQAWEARDFPFETIEIVTRFTPNLVQPTGPEAGIPATYYDNAQYFEGFWPRALATGQDFKFHLVGIDGAGRRIPFEAPLFFLTDSKNDAAHLASVKQVYNAPTNTRAKVSMNGAKIQLAPQAAGADPGDTHFPVSTITFQGASPSGAAPITSPQFYPALASAEVSIPSVKAMLGANAKPSVSYSKIYKQNGFLGANKGQVFLDIAAPAALSGDPAHPPTTFGGMITPSVLPSAFSRSFGAVQGKPDPGNTVGQAAAFAQGGFNPLDYIPDDAKLLGAVKLKDVLRGIADMATDLGSVPKLSSVELPDQIVASYTLTQSDLHKVDPFFLPDPGNSLSITAKAIAKRDGSPPQADVTAKVSNFRVSLFGCFILKFNSLDLTAGTGKKTDVKPHLDPKDGVLFGGPLEFVNSLRDVIPMGGFSDGSGISVNPLGITAAYTLSLPTISVGVASLSNISLGAGFDLPFTGDPPSARFNFAQRQSPFNLTISLFGGGGFFAIGVGTEGVKEVEAALEFGAQISIDLGVASGGVYVKGGFYFHWIGATNEIDFEGYVELGGHLSILGLISVSLTFHLGLAYQKLPPSSKLYGEATLTVEVTVLFFSFGVDVHVEKQFAGSKSDPIFLDFAPTPAVWTTYCDAFA